MSIARQPKGVPTGGQFAPGARPESTTDVSGTTPENWSFISSPSSVKADEASRVLAGIENERALVQLAREIRRFHRGAEHFSMAQGHDGGYPATSVRVHFPDGRTEPFWGSEIGGDALGHLYSQDLTVRTPLASLQADWDEDFTSDDDGFSDLGAWPVDAVADHEIDRTSMHAQRAIALLHMRAAVQALEWEMARDHA